jgi:hypothetical protein
MAQRRFLDAMVVSSLVVSITYTLKVFKHGTVLVVLRCLESHDQTIIIIIMIMQQSAIYGIRNSSVIGRPTKLHNAKPPIDHPIIVSFCALSTWSASIPPSSVFTKATLDKESTTNHVTKGCRIIVP